MKKYLAIVSLLLLVPAQSYALGWFFVGMLMGSGDDISYGPGGNMFIEVYNKCDKKSSKVLINTGTIRSIKAARYHAHEWTTIKTGDTYYCLWSNYAIVKKVLFRTKAQIDKERAAIKSK